MMLSNVCLSVAYIGPKSRTETPRKTKIGTEVAHVTRTPLSRSKGQGHKGRGHIVAASRLTACYLSGYCSAVYSYNSRMYIYSYQIRAPYCCHAAEDCFYVAVSRTEQRAIGAEFVSDCGAMSMTYPAGRRANLRGRISRGRISAQRNKNSAI